MGKRFMIDIPVNKPDEQVWNTARGFFAHEGFRFTQINGEPVWKKGNGIVSAPQYIKFFYQNGVAHIEAWLKFAILPGVYCGEMGLTGAWGFAIKQALKGKVDALCYHLQQLAAQPENAVQ